MHLKAALYRYENSIFKMTTNFKSKYSKNNHLLQKSYKFSLAIVVILIAGAFLSNPYGKYLSAIGIFLMFSWFLIHFFFIANKLKLENEEKSEIHKKFDKKPWE